MVEVFKTEIRNFREAQVVENRLRKQLGSARIAFDLGDCDRILRIEASNVKPELIIDVMKGLKIACEVLEG